MKKFTIHLPKQKLNVFLVCLFCSFIAWSVSKLSETQTDVTTFALDFTRIPDSLILDEASRTGVDLRVRASGFQFLGLQLSRRRLTIDLKDVQNSPRGYYLPRQSFLSQIERQIPGTMDLLEMDSDTLYIKFLSVHTKKVPVIPDLKLNLGPSYLLEGRVLVEPDSILLIGPKAESDTIARVTTEPVVLNNQMEDFDIEVNLKLPTNPEHLTFSRETVRLSAGVFRFSEKIMEVPVEVINLPEGTEIKTFPTTVEILCKARIELLKDLNARDFRVVADYRTLNRGRSYLELVLLEIPEVVHSAELLEDQVEFILKRQ